MVIMSSSFSPTGSDDSNSTVTSSNSRSGNKINLTSLLDGFSPSDFLPADLPYPAKCILLSVYVIIIVVSGTGNGLVMFVVGLNQSMKTVTNVFLVSLSASDLLMAALTMPFQLNFLLDNEWRMGQVLCKLTNYIQGVVVVSSILTMSAISVERFYAICHPLKARNLHTIRRTVILVLVIWSASFIIVSPQTIVQRLDPILEIRNKQLRVAQICVEFFPDRRLEIAYNLFFYIALYILPLSTIFFAYGSIVCRLWRSTAPPGDASRGECARRVAQRKRSVRMLVVIVLLFALSWFPFFTLHLVTVFKDDINTSGAIFRIAAASLQLVAYSNSCTNPIIYCFMSDNFREHFRRAICCRRFRGRHPSQNTRTTPSHRYNQTPQSIEGEMSETMTSSSTQHVACTVSTTMIEISEEYQMSQKLKISSKNCPGRAGRRLPTFA